MSDHTPSFPPGMMLAEGTPAFAHALELGNALPLRAPHAGEMIGLDAIREAPPPVVPVELVVDAVKPVAAVEPESAIAEDPVRDIVSEIERLQRQVAPMISVPSEVIDIINASNAASCWVNVIRYLEQARETILDMTGEAA